MATSSSRLPAECFLQPESEDEESFVVLGTSLPPESLVADCGSVVSPSIQTTVVQDSLKLTSSAISQLNISSSSYPSLPKVKQEVMAPLQDREFNTVTSNSSIDLSPDEIQQKVDMLIDENLKLKDTLQQNNLAMKKQYETLVLWQEDVMKVHKSHKEKFSETKKYIENLKLENAKLVEALKVSHMEQSQLKQELEARKIELDEATSLAKDKADYSLLLKSIYKEEGESELIAARKEVTELEALVSTLKMNKSQNSSSDQVQTLRKELLAGKELNAKQAAEYAKEKQEFESLQKILLEEVKVLKMQLNEKLKAVISKEVHDNVQEQLMAAQMHITRLEQLRNEDKEIIDVREEKIIKLEELTHDMSESSDTMAALRAQLELYKSDFEAERQAKESIKAEKEQVADDLRHLQRRNQQLLEEVERLRTGDFIHVARPEQSSTAASAPRDTPEAKFSCPKCSFKFYNYQAVENHVHRCLEIDSLF